MLPRLYSYTHSSGLKAEVKRTVRTFRKARPKHSPAQPKKVGCQVEKGRAVLFPYLGDACTLLTFQAFFAHVT
jgi:hypothetical protein